MQRPNQCAKMNCAHTQNRIVARASPTRRNLRDRDARMLHSRRRSALKAAPRPPPSAATATMNGNCRSQSLLFRVCTFVKTMMPASPLLENSDTVNTARIVVTKHRHACLRLQKEQASSMLKSTPPIGAPKAACMHAVGAYGRSKSRWCCESSACGHRVLPVKLR